MKKIFAFLLLACIGLTALSGCGTSKIPFNGMLDTDTDKVYQLGDSKEKFDDAFGTSKFDETSNEYSYLSGILTVVFDENECASEIESSGKSNRFEFCNFSFDNPIKEIEGRYEKFDEATGYIFYTIYYDEKGNTCSLYDSKYSAQLMVRDGDLDVIDLQDGEYVHYTIRIED